MTEFNYQYLLKRAVIVEAKTEQLAQELTKKYQKLFAHFKPWQIKLMGKKWAWYIRFLLILSLFGIIFLICKTIIQKKFLFLWKNTIKLEPWHQFLFDKTLLKGAWKTHQTEPHLTKMMDAKKHLFDIPPGAKNEARSLVMEQRCQIGVFYYQLMQYKWRSLSSSGSASWTTQKQKKVVAIRFVPYVLQEKKQKAWLFRLDNNQNIITKKAKPKTWVWYKSKNAFFLQTMNLCTNNLTATTTMMNERITDFYVRNNRWMTYAFTKKWYLYRQTTSYFMCYTPRNLGFKTHLEPMVTKPKKVQNIDINDLRWITSTVTQIKKDFFNFYTACEMILLTNNYQF